MGSLGLIRAGSLFPIAAYVERAGIDPASLVARCRLPACVLTDAELLVPTASLGRLLDAAARYGDDTIGARAGQAADIAMLGTFGRLIRGAPTLGEALEAIVQHHPGFNSNGRVWVDSHGADVELCQVFTNIDERWRQTAFYSLTLMVNVVRLAAGPKWRPLAAKLQAAALNARHDVECLSGTRIRPAQAVTSIVIPRELLAAPLPPFEPPTAVEIDAWRLAAPGLDFVRSIGQIIETLAWDGYPNIETTASAVGTSVRTLQRQLAKAGYTHEQLLARSRCAIATALLEKTDTKILDIALDLGYSDHAHFTRAFRRWTGHSPQEFRQSRAANR